jgi:hypothetical protein
MTLLRTAHLVMDRDGILVDCRLFKEGSVEIPRLGTSRIPALLGLNRYSSVVFVVSEEGISFSKGNQGAIHHRRDLIP